VPYAGVSRRAAREFKQEIFPRRSLLSVSLALWMLCGTSSPRRAAMKTGWEMVFFVLASLIGVPLMIAAMVFLIVSLQ